MTTLRVLTVGFLLLALAAAGCSQEEKSDYKGVSDIISNRNKARRSVGKYPSKSFDEPLDQDRGDASTAVQSDRQQEEGEEIQSIILYEEEVTIVSEVSRKELARGVAYINKQGQIVRLKIVNK